MCFIDMAIDFVWRAKMFTAGEVYLQYGQSHVQVSWSSPLLKLIRSQKKNRNTLQVVLIILLLNNEVELQGK